MASNIDVTMPVHGTPTTQSVRDNFAVAASEITALQGGMSGGPFLSLPDGGTVDGQLHYTATGGTTSRSAQDRAAEVLYAEDYGVVPNAADNTAALQAFFAALQAYPGAVKGVLPSGWLQFTTPIVAMNNRQNWSLVGSGYSATHLHYIGASTTVDLLRITGCANFSVKGFTIDSGTAMTDGTAFHLDGCGHVVLGDIKVGGQGGYTHVGSDTNLHYNLWNGFWFDKIDMVTLSNFEAVGQNDAVRVNGAVAGGGGKADLTLQLGKITSSGVGLHVGGAFGGLMVDNCGIIGNWHNCVIDQALAAEQNREIFFGPHALFDSSGQVGTTGGPGATNPGGTGDNVVVNDPGGGFLAIKGWVVTTYNGGIGIHIQNWAGDINTGGCVIYQCAGDGIQIQTPQPTLLMSPTTHVFNNTGYGINQTTVMNPILGAPVLSQNTAGNMSATTRLSLAVDHIAPSTVWANAGGTTQANATPLIASCTIVFSAPAGSGFVLLSAPVGTRFEVVNLTGTAPFNVYPPVGWAFPGSGVNTPLVVLGNYRGVFVMGPSSSIAPVYIGPVRIP